MVDAWCGEKEGGGVGGVGIDQWAIVCMHSLNSCLAVFCDFLYCDIHIHLQYVFTYIG